MSSENLVPEDGYLLLGDPNAVAVAAAGMVAEDVVGTYRYLLAVEVAWAKTEPFDPVDEISDPYSRYLDIFEHAIGWLPEKNLELSREVYGALADSPLVHDRQAISAHLAGITRADPEYGLSLWDRLIRDYSPPVRKAAYWVLTDREPDEFLSRHDLEDAAASRGISIRDFVHLERRFVEASRGENVHDPRRESFARMIGALSRQQLQSGA